MAQQHYTWVPLVALFGMLWFPVGQYEFLMCHWMKIGTYAVPFLLFGVLTIREQCEARPLLADFKVLSVGLLVAYILHQDEEHWRTSLLRCLSAIGGLVSFCGRGVRSDGFWRDHHAHRFHHAHRSGKIVEIGNH